MTQHRNPRFRFAFPLAAATALSLLLLPAAGVTQSPGGADTARIDQVLAQGAAVKRVGDVALSPDGQHLAWMVSGALMVGHWNASGAHPVTVPGGCGVTTLRWAPDSSSLAVMTRCRVDPSNTRPIAGAIWLVSANAGAAPRKVAGLQGFASDLQWAPDGKAVGFLYMAGATRLAQATASSNPRVGVIGGNDERPEQVATVAIASGALQTLTPPGLYAYEFNFSPHGRRLVFTAAPPPGDDNWWTAKLYVQTNQPGAQPTVVVDPASVAGSLHGMQMQQPTFSPDGRDIYFVGGLMSDRGVDSGDLYRVAASGGAPVDTTPGIPVTLHQFTFLNPHELLFTQENLGHEEVAKYSVNGDAVHSAGVLFTVPGSARGVSVSQSEPHRIAYACSSFEHAPEVYSGVLGSQPPPAVTSLNAGLKPSWGQARSVQWRNGAFLVQGWLLYPANFDPHRKYPLIVSVHGGPTSANQPSWGGRPTIFSQFGYFVLLPNPRGSTGEGEAFVRQDQGAGKMGYGDLDDILKGIDKVETLAPIDDNRLGMTGWSYGGFMSMFAPTQTNRFKAVVAGAGLSDWESYYGENQIDQWMIPFFGASVYLDPAAYAKSSAINFITHDHTPALIVVGERDEECPAPQSFEYWHALRAMHVPATLVVYANQGHAIADPKDQEDILRRSLAWFGKYLAPESTRAGH
ncbi:MAG TPA: S9 family peptidase [Terriglobales bacterium]|nr:S9 family peptidase [Terriglobales bacterium]